MGPQRDATTAVRTDPARKPSTVMVAAFTPREVAHSSPSEMRFQAGAYAITTAHTASTTTENHPSVEYSTASKPPINQREMAKDWAKLATLCRKRMMAKQRLFMV